MTPSRDHLDAEGAAAFLWWMEDFMGLFDAGSLNHRFWRGGPLTNLSSKCCDWWVWSDETKTEKNATLMAGQVPIGCEVANLELPEPLAVFWENRSVDVCRFKKQGGWSHRCQQRSTKTDPKFFFRVSEPLKIHRGFYGILSDKQFGTGSPIQPFSRSQQGIPNFTISST